MPKILLVEDDPLIYRMYQKLFNLEGFETEVAENGQLGLDKLQEFHPDVILLDIMMPTMNGLEMLTKLKADPATKDIPVAVLTNMSDVNVANQVFDKGAQLTIVKSETEPDTVIAWINSVLTKNNSAAASGGSDQPADDQSSTDDQPASDDQPSADE
jgi:CheY-like chemotaxis protein